MNRTPVSSSNIRSVGYDAGNQVLEVEFANGGVYQYHGVPPDLHQQLVSAKSVGNFFAQQVRGKVKSQKLGTETPPRS